MKNIYELSNAIIRQASVDYVEALVTIKTSANHNTDKVRRAKLTLQDCVQFFRSDWFRNLNNTSVNGDEYMRLMTKMVEKELIANKRLKTEPTNFKELESA